MGFVGKDKMFFWESNFVVFFFTALFEDAFE